MTAASALATLLQRLSDTQLEHLATACACHDTPPDDLGRAVSGASPGGQEAVARLAEAWRSTDRLTGQGIALALRTGLAARQDADRRRSSPVWTGPGANGEQRLTAGVLHELIAGAREQVLLVSYAAYTLSEVADDLEAAVARGCNVDVVFETTLDSAGQYDGPASTPFGSVSGVSRWRWPADRRSDGAVLHAKLLVVDRRRALVGSANLTSRALTTNLEAGVLLRDPEVARSLDEHVRNLMQDGVLIPAE